MRRWPRLPLRWTALAGGAGVLLIAACASRGGHPPPAWTAAAPEMQSPGTSPMRPPPPISAETDPENTEQRFPHAENRARRATEKKNQSAAGLVTAGSVGPVAPGAAVPPPAPTRLVPTPDAGIPDGGRPVR